MTTAVSAAPAAPPTVPAATWPRPYRWTCDEFHQMGDMGWFEGRTVILVEGEILEMPPPNPPHETANGLADYAFKAVFPAGHWVRVQMTLALGQGTDPVPDLAVVAGSPRDYPHHPTTARLVIEVSDSSLAYDRGDKASLYAAGGIDDYWVVNLIDRRVEVFRDPRPDPAAAFGHRYTQVTIHAPGTAVTPLAAPQTPVAVADLLP